MPGLLALVGGDEFHPGNEPHDELLAAAARGRGVAYIVATAAGRSHPEAAVRHAADWFRQFGLAVTELRAYTKTEALVPDTVEAAGRAAFIYITGGDPGLVASVLRRTPVGDAIINAWRNGAVLAGSSAGAMALCEHVLVRQRFPGSAERRPVAGLAVVPNAAVLPHHNTFGGRWFPSARAALPEATLIGIDERTCVLWEAGTWRCLGSGGVTVYDRGGARDRYLSGSAVDGLPEFSERMTAIMTDAVAQPDPLQAYVDGIASEYRPLFDRIDRLTHALHPEATVSISYGMPTYRVGKRRLNVGVWKHGVSIYGWKQNSPAAFLSHHPELVTSTGTIRLTPDDGVALTDEEIGEVIRSALGS